MIMAFTICTGRWSASSVGDVYACTMNKYSVPALISGVLFAACPSNCLRPAHPNVPLPSRS